MQIFQCSIRKLDSQEALTSLGKFYRKCRANKNCVNNMVYGILFLTRKYFESWKTYTG